MSDRLGVLAILADVEREFAEIKKLRVAEQQRLAAAVERNHWIASAPEIVVVISALVAMVTFLVLLVGR